MEPMTAASATLLRRDATISTEKPASFVVTFKQEVCTGEGEEEGVSGAGEEAEGGVRPGGEEEMVRQTRYSVAGSRWVRLYS